MQAIEGKLTKFLFCNLQTVITKNISRKVGILEGKAYLTAN